MSKEKQLLDDLNSVVKEARLMGCKEVRTCSNVPIENIDIIIAALEEQLSNRWIPCSKRLPSEEECNLFDVNHPNYGKFICTVKIALFKPQVRELYYSKVFGWKYGPEDYNDYVIAWKPLPEPYKEGIE